MRNVGGLPLLALAGILTGCGGRLAPDHLEGAVQLRFAWLVPAPDAWKYERFCLELKSLGYFDGLPVPVPDLTLGRPADGAMAIDITVGETGTDLPCASHDWVDGRPIIKVSVGCSSDRLGIALTHELVETIVDPGANHDEKELADICQARTPTAAETTIDDVAGDHYLVARYWSASKNGCFPFL